MTVIDLKPGMSISDAASSAPEGAVLLRLHPGIYKEKVFIRRDDVAVEGTGEKPEEVRIEWGDGAFEMMPDGIKRGTFRSYTFFIKGNGNRLRNLTVENTAYPREKAGQAIALFAEGDLICEKLVLKSFQDTLYTGPLPVSEKEPGGFGRPNKLYVMVRPEFDPFRRPISSPAGVRKRAPSNNTMSNTEKSNTLVSDSESAAQGRYRSSGEFLDYSTKEGESL